MQAFLANVVYNICHHPVLL